MPQFVQWLNEDSKNSISSSQIVGALLEDDNPLYVQKKKIQAIKMQTLNMSEIEIVFELLRIQP